MPKVRPVLKLICFDLDNTLWCMDYVIQRAETALLTQLQTYAPLKNLTLEALRMQKQETMQNQPSISHDPTRLRKAALCNLLTRAGTDQAHQAAHQLMDLFLRERNQVTPFASTEPVLKQLQHRYSLASITNGNACLRTIGLADYFKIKVSPASAGVKKPDAQIFREALQSAKVCADQALHVGDHWEDDMLGAKAAGLHTLWINPSQQPWPGNQDDPPDGIIRGIQQVPAFLETFSTRQS